MLAYISGKIIIKKENYIIIVTNDLGYKVFLSPKIIAQLAEEAQLYLYQQVKEDGTVLFGFKTIAELEFFELLLTVSGIGPKSGLAILSSAKIDDLKASIASGDSELLTKVSGVGRKTAERLVVELKNKVDYLASSSDHSFGSGYGDELDALVSLGYSASLSREALGKISNKITDSSQRVKEALKIIGR